MRTKIGPAVAPVAAFVFATAGAAPALGAVEVGKLLPDMYEAEDRFGWNVAADENYVVVGAETDAVNGTFAGAAYIFDASTKQQLFKVYPDDPIPQQFFGCDVAVNDGVVLIGAYGDDENGGIGAGAVYVFDAATGQQLDKLLPADGAPPYNFGWSVALDGDLALIGSPRDFDAGPNAGSAYVFDISTGQQVDKLIPADIADSDGFGWSVALKGPTAVIGSRGDDDNGAESGSAYVFDLRAEQQVHKLLASDGAANDRFGSSVAVRDGVIAVGAPRRDTNGPASGSFMGKVYLFDATTGQETLQLTAPDGAGGDLFGTAVALHDDGTVYAGAPYHQIDQDGSGAVYGFDADTGQQVDQFYRTGTDTVLVLGWDISIVGDRVYAGAHFDEENGPNSGSIFIFDVSDCAVADIGGDGVVDTADLGILISQFGTAGPEGDLNGDGVVDSADLGILIGAFGTMCP